MFKKKTPKQGEITINHQSSNEYVKKHCILNDGNGNGYVMTSKQKPASGAKVYGIDQDDVTDFAISGDAYLTNHRVENNSGKVIGKLKPQTYKNFKQWLLVAGTVVVVLFILFS